MQVSAVRNVIMDLGGVMLEWNPDHLLMPFQPEPELRRQLRASVFSHDWRLFDRGQLTEAELLARLEIGTGESRDTLMAIIAAARGCLSEKPETLKMVRALRQRGFNLYCLSNMPCLSMTFRPMSMQRGVSACTPFASRARPSASRNLKCCSAPDHGPWR
jgi:FMN phosphatase YigB (HAD superfamily)